MEITSKNINGKSGNVKRSKEFDEFLESMIDTIEEQGFLKRLKKPQLERLILRHALIKQIRQDIIIGFQGISELNEKTKGWLYGR